MKRLIVCRGDGTIDMLHDDALCAQLFTDPAKIKITRASEVEWEADNPKGPGWYANMLPSGHDIKLGPYPIRQAALDAEQVWLNENVLRKEATHDVLHLGPALQSHENDRGVQPALQGS